MLSKTSSEIDPGLLISFNSYPKMVSSHSNIFKSETNAPPRHAGPAGKANQSLLAAADEPSTHSMAM